MNISTSECSSGCESGWTMYLNQLSSSTDKYNRSIPVDGEYRRKGGNIYEDEEEDEDLSMLSDASSGPPHFQREEEEEEEDWSEEARYTCNVSAAQQKMNKHRMKVKDQRRMQQNFHLDDTASSPVLSFPKASQKSIFHQNNVAFENGKSLMEHDSGYSATHYKAKSVLKKRFGFFKPSRTGKAD